MAPSPDIQQRFENALSAFIERARQDPYILGVVLCGSLSHDSVWEKSDIDLLVITKEKDKIYGKGEEGLAFALVEDGINIHATLLNRRSAFRKMIEGSTQSSFLHSLVAKGKLVFSRDPTLGELFADIQKMGSRDQQVQVLRAATSVLPLLYKAEKWFHVRGDLNYSFLWITYCITALARVEVALAGQIAGREVIQQALALNPDFFDAIYTGLVNGKKTTATISASLAQIDDYLTRRRRTLFGPILDYLQEAGAPRSATEIDTHFADHYRVEGAVTACEWLADKDVIHKVSSPVRLTEKSPVSFEELAFLFDATAQEPRDPATPPKPEKRSKR